MFYAIYNVEYEGSSVAEFGSLEGALGFCTQLLEELEDLQSWRVIEGKEIASSSK